MLKAKMTRVLAVLSAALGMIPLAFVWSEFAYRLKLYFRYGSQPYLNHVGDGYFSLMFVAALGAAGIFVVAGAISLAHKMKIFAAICALGIILAITNVAVIRQMHASKALVTYSEFVKNMGP